MHYSQKIMGCILGLLLAASPMAFAKPQDDSAKETHIEIIPIRDGIYMLTGQGGNIGLSIGTDGVFMIDDQFAPLTAKIKAAIATLSDQPIRFVMNTHWHFDHTGGNENLGREGVVIVAHDHVRERMSHDNFITAFNKKIPASPDIALPAVTFNDRMTFHVNQRTIHISHHRNAHTDGDSIVVFKKANVIHTGDIFFNGLYPFIDASSHGSINGMIKTVEHILSLANAQTKIIPGHGPLANKADLATYRDMLITVRKRMQTLIDQGKTLDEIIAIKPNQDFDATWGTGFLNPEAFLSVLYSVMPK